MKLQSRCFSSLLRFFWRLHAGCLLLILCGFVQNAQPQVLPQASHVLKAFEITDPADPNHGLLKRSANAGLDWYFTSLALVLAPDEAVLQHGAHFEAALRHLPVAGPLPLGSPAGLRRISDSAQLWELQITVVAPLSWECAFVAFPRGAPVGWRHTDACGRVWRNWGRIAVDAHWTLTDTTDDFLALRQPDSHDAQAAVFVLALARWVKLSQQPDWLQATVWRLPAAGKFEKPRPITRVDLIKHMVRHNLLNHMQDGLFRTFRHNRHPQGGLWDVQYLMDNIECQAALRALIPLFEGAGHSAFADVLRHYETALTQALDSLISQQAGAPTHYRRWARQSDWPSDAVELAFYPYIAGQYWAGLFQPAGQSELPLRWLQMEPHMGKYSDWWRQGVLHLGAGLPPYLARLVHSPGSLADQSPVLLQHLQSLTPENTVISDYVTAWRIQSLLLPPADALSR